MMLKRTLVALSVVASLSAFHGQLAAQQVPAFGVQDAVGEPGGTVRTTVLAQDADDIGAFDMVLTYDPNVLHIIEASTGSSASDSLIEWSETRDGRIVVAMADVNGLSGDGAVLEIDFDLIGSSGDQSLVAIESVQAYHYDTLIDLPVTTSSGLVTVEKAGVGWLTGLGGIALLGGLAVLVVLAILLSVGQWRRGRA